MKSNDLVAVIIPVYKPHLNSAELVSLKRCISILKNHPIIFICPCNLNTTVYENTCANKVEFKLIRFEDHYFADLSGYNKLMLSAFFYKTFLDYRYILIYQLDAYVFKDELIYWCDQKYDFVGAPALPHRNGPNEMQFLKGYAKFIGIINRLLHTHHKISNVGNGGLSLRKTSTFYRLLIILKLKVKKWGTNNEDGFFKYWGNLLYPFFKLPPDDIALQFSIEHKPREALKQLHGKLPFGCHAFEKYEPEVWKQYIEFTT